MTELTIVGVPSVWYALGIGFGLLIISFWVRSILIYGAIILCIFSILFGGEVKDIWVQGGLTLVVLWCIVAIIKAGGR